jgi:hypothetical protein
VTIEGYFPAGNWEVNLIEGIYLIHLYSVFPEFLLISKYSLPYSGRECLELLDLKNPRKERSRSAKSYTS